MNTPIPSSPIANPGGLIATPWYLFFQGSPQTFTPRVTFGGVSAGVTYTVQVGQATTGFGRVFFDIVISLSAKGAGVGNAVITGLPQVVKSVSNYKPSFTVGFASSFNTTVATTIMTSGSQSESQIYLNQFTAGASTPLTNNDFTSTTEVRISGNYQV